METDLSSNSEHIKDNIDHVMLWKYRSTFPDTTVFKGKALFSFKIGVL